ncbi:hypothetical protein KIN20_019172 [Parelaphostrongylus tenuis]|uniref:Uncharacterized protein n=1 Tax=Parelaphostrongylus tenuis TaxID=148309 RepID=A0AAD5N569_PARTN|nr:hypothetical protein KIN20_019172 [Parelaphostrongylus tenuis]
MSYQVQFVCIGLIILHCITAGLSNVEDNRIMERTSEKILNSTTAAPNNSTPTKIGTSTKPTSHPFTTTVQPGVLRPPNFTTGSFFIGFCLAITTVAIAYGAVHLWNRHRALSQPYQIY